MANGEERSPGSEVRVKEFQEGEGVGNSDGSRMEGVTAGATAEGGIFLGELATVMDGEIVGIAGSWEEGYRLCVHRFESSTPQKDFLTSKEHGFVLKRFPLLS